MCASADSGSAAAAGPVPDRVDAPAGGRVGRAGAAAAARRSDTAPRLQRGQHDARRRAAAARSLPHQRAELRRGQRQGDAHAQRVVHDAPHPDPRGTL